MQSNTATSVSGPYKINFQSCLIVTVKMTCLKDGWEKADFSTSEGCFLCLQSQVLQMAIN
jgi:hypothetical protein